MESWEERNRNGAAGCVCVCEVWSERMGFVTCEGGFPRNLAHTYTHVSRTHTAHTPLT